MEIVFLIAFIFVTYFIWGNLEINAHQVITTADLANMLRIYEKDKGDRLELYSLSDEYAMSNIKPTIFVVENPLASARSYALTLVIDKNSTLDYEQLIISLGNDIYRLSDFKKTEDCQAIHLFFPQNKVINYNEYEIRMWLDEKAGTEIEGKSLIMNLEVIENV